MSDLLEVIGDLLVAVGVAFSRDEVPQEKPMTEWPEAIFHGVMLGFIIVIWLNTVNLGRKP